MALLLLAALVIGVVVVRELARWLALGGRPQLRAIFDLATPGSLRRRTLAILAGLVATYLAVVALGYAYARGYGIPTGVYRYAVGAVLAGGAAEGKLVAGDRIDALDGELVFVDSGPSLTERVNAKAGAPVDVHVTRSGTPHVLRIEPQQDRSRGLPTWLLGIRPAIDTERQAVGALGFALAYPARHARSVVGSLASIVGGSEAEVGSVVRITEELRVEASVGERALTGALPLSGHLLLLFVLLDLIRLAIVIRDRLRG